MEPGRRFKNKTFSHEVFDYKLFENYIIKNIKELSNEYIELKVFINSLFHSLIMAISSVCSNIFITLILDLMLNRDVVKTVYLSKYAIYGNDGCLQ